MKRFLLIVCMALCAVCGTSQTIDSVRITTDSIPPLSDSITPLSDSVPLTPKEIDRLFWKPDPARAVWLGALVPGLGQIYNRSYWKLPIVYGGVMGCAYGITVMQDKYISYSNAYRELYHDIEKGCVTEDPSKTYIAVMPEGYTIARMGGASTYMNRLKDWQSTYRRYRDLSIMAAVLVYSLSLIDAYVDAQLFDFDVSDNLSLDVTPQIYYDVERRPNAELKLAITF